MLKIDAHSHLIPEQLPRFADKFGYQGFIHLEHHKPGYAKMMMGDKFFREIAANCWDAECRLDDLLANQIDVQVVCAIPVMFSYWAKPHDTLQLAQYLNDRLAEFVAQYPKRFVGLCTLPMQDPELAARELERCMTQLNLAGVQIGSHINEWNLNDTALYPFYDACVQYNASLFVHPWDMMGKEHMQRYWLPWLVGMPAETSRAICSMIFGGIFERYPQLRVLFSHGGGSFPATIGRIEHAYNCRPDLVAIDNPINPRNYLGKFWVDSIVFEPAMMRYLLEIIGPDKIALGSDYPFPLGDLETGKMIDNMNLDPDIQAKIFYKSALTWLDKKEEDFI